MTRATSSMSPIKRVRHRGSHLADLTLRTLATSLDLLGIEIPDRM